MESFRVFLATKLPTWKIYEPCILALRLRGYCVSHSVYTWRKLIIYNSDNFHSNSLFLSQWAKLANVGENKWRIQPSDKEEGGGHPERPPSVFFFARTDGPQFGRKIRGAHPHPPLPLEPLPWIRYCKWLPTRQVTREGSKKMRGEGRV